MSTNDTLKEKVQQRMRMALSTVERDTMLDSDITHTAEAAIWCIEEEVQMVLDEITNGSTWGIDTAAITAGRLKTMNRRIDEIRNRYTK